MKSQQTFSVIFLARKGKNDSTNSLIHARISANGLRTEFSLQQKVPSDLWDKARGHVKGHTVQAKKINQYLSQIGSEIFDACDQLRRNDDIIFAKAIKSRFLIEDENTCTLLGAVEYHYQLALNTIRPGTLKNYRTTVKHVRSFLQDELRCDNMFLSRSRYSFITKFENYLRMHQPTDHQKPMGNNTVMKHLQRLRKIVSMTVRLEWIDKDPFFNYKASYDRTERAFLAGVELEAIESKVLKIDRLVYVIIIKENRCTALCSCCNRRSNQL